MIKSGLENYCLDGTGASIYVYVIVYVELITNNRTHVR